MIGETLGHYRILELLGEGGMGKVYRAEDTNLVRQVALKVLPDQVAANRETLARFQQEARTLAAVDHPNVVTIYSVEESAGIYFITMQLVEGRRLSEMIPRDGMAASQFLDIVAPLAEGLAAAHERGVIHRDLKPGNIMVTDEHLVKILDFGLAKPDSVTAQSQQTEVPTQPLTKEGRLVGTVPYMSPEQLESKPVDPRTDIFSLGIVFYELATGRRPFDGDSPLAVASSIIKDTPESVDSLKQGFSPEVGKFIDRCLELHMRQQLDANDAAIAKLHATETLMTVLDDCLQLHGGYGYMWEFPIARAWAGHRVSRIAGGSSEIMKEIIARAM